MYTKIIFALMLATFVSQKTPASSASAPRQKVDEAKVYFLRGNLKIKRIPIYRAKGLDPYLYSGSFPWGGVV